MEIEPQSLTTCEIEPDGSALVLGFIDANGISGRVRLSIDQAGALAMTLPDLIARALRSRYGDDTLRYAYSLASWTLERSSDHKTSMITLSTTDGFSACFSMQRELQDKLAEALASDGPYRPKIVAH